MIILTEDSSEEMAMLANYWIADLKAAGYDEETLGQISSMLTQCAAQSWQHCHDDDRSEILQQFVDWARQRGVVLPWLETGNPPAN